LRKITPATVTFGGDYAGEAGNVLVYNVKKNREDQAMGQIGQPIRRYTVIPLEEPIAPNTEPVRPSPPNKAPNNPVPVTRPEPQPAK